MDPFLQDYSFAVDLLGISKDNSSVLDVGCGIYRLGEVFRRLDYSNIRHVGLDGNFLINEDMRRKALGFRGNGDLVCALGEEMPFSENSFDYVLCCGLPIYDTSRMRRIASELVRVCKPRGRILVTQPCKRYKDNIYLPQLLEEFGLNKLFYASLHQSRREVNGPFVIEYEYHIFEK